MQRKVWENTDKTSKETCGCGSWKDHWQNRSRQDWPAKCNFPKCENPAEVGAHVNRVKHEGEIFITPLCKACNSKRNQIFYLKDDNLAVRLTYTEDCNPG
jgi:C4-type Zn-finger protein